MRGSRFCPDPAWKIMPRVATMKKFRCLKVRRPNWASSIARQAPAPARLSSLPSTGEKPRVLCGVLPPPLFVVCLALGRSLGGLLCFACSSLCLSCLVGCGATRVGLPLRRPRQRAATSSHFSGWEAYKKFRCLKFMAFFLHLEDYDSRTKPRGR